MKRGVCQVHLSSRNGFALPESSGKGSMTRASTPLVKRESSPVPVKREPSPETPGPISSWPEATGEIDITPKIEDCGYEEESVVEVRVARQRASSLQFDATRLNTHPRCI